MSTVRASSGPTTSSAQPTVRRLIVYTLLFALVTIAAIGLSGLLGRAMDRTDLIVAGDVAGLAQSLAFTLIGGPLAALLWWAVWRRLGDETERSSLAWGLYLAAMYTVALITFSTSLLTTAAVLVDDADWRPRTFATGIVWAGVWVWHRWMSRHPVKRPVHLVNVPPVVGWVFGLVIGVGGAVTALGSLLDAAIRGSSADFAVGQPWWVLTLQGLIWAIGGGVIWWWHWLRGNVRALRTGLADVALVAFGVLAASALTLGGVGTIVYVLLRLAFDRSEPISDILGPLGEALAAAAIGSLVWFYHRGIARARSEATRQAGTLVTSGVALVAAASGLGVIVNVALSTLTAPLAGSDLRTLLMGGIAALIVGGPVWWFTWKPTVPVEPTALEYPGRRIYLIAVFGLSAVVALITLLVIGFRLFEFLLDDVTGGSLVDRVRAPLGLLVATGLVAGYHFSVWRRDRAALAAVTPTRHRTIGHVVLVTAADAEAQSRAIDDATGASVTVWTRAPGAEETAEPGPDLEQFARALEGVSAKRVLVVVGPGARVDVIPLAG